MKKELIKKLKAVAVGQSPKKCCRNCHFLTKSHVARDNVYRGSWDGNEREQLFVPEPYTSECARGIWSTAIEPNLFFDLKDILLENRKDNCFFIEYHEGMSFQAAEELHRIRNDNRQLKKSYRYTQIGLWIAAVSMFIAAVPIAKPIIVEWFNKLANIFQ